MGQSLRLLSVLLDFFPLKVYDLEAIVLEHTVIQQGLFVFQKVEIDSPQIPINAFIEILSTENVQVLIPDKLTLVGSPTGEFSHDEELVPAGGAIEQVLVLFGVVHSEFGRAVLFVFLLVSL